MNMVSPDCLWFTQCTVSTCAVCIEWNHEQLHSCNTVNMVSDLMSPMEIYRCTI